MNTYELTFIISPVVSQEKIDSITEKVKKIITEKNGQVLLFEPEGVKKLAYPVKGHRDGNYFFVEFTAPGETVAALENLFRLDDAVIRYLTVLKPRPRKIKSKKAKKNVMPSVNEQSAPAADPSNSTVEQSNR